MKKAARKIYNICFAVLGLLAICILAGMAVSTANDVVDTQVQIDD